MPDLVFIIKTPAELQGAQQAAQALEVAIGKAKALGNSNGVVYLLTSDPGSLTWAATNKIAP